MYPGLHESVGEIFVAEGSLEEGYYDELHEYYGVEKPLETLMRFWHMLPAEAQEEDF